MKEIKAYIRKERADLVIKKLEESGVKGMTVLLVNALAEWADKESFSFSIEYVQKYSTVVKIELICSDEEVDKLTEIVTQHAHTGKSGDGWVFISSVDKAVRIRTGKVNDIENL